MFSDIVSEGKKATEGEEFTKLINCGEVWVYYSNKMLHGTEEGMRLRIQCCS